MHIEMQLEPNGMNEWHGKCGAFGKIKMLFSFPSWSAGNIHNVKYTSLGQNVNMWECETNQSDDYDGVKLKTLFDRGFKRFIAVS